MFSFSFLRDVGYDPSEITSTNRILRFVYVFVTVRCGVSTKTKTSTRFVFVFVGRLAMAFVVKKLLQQKKSVQRVTCNRGICFERAIVNHTPSSQKKRLLCLLFCPNPPQLLANQNTMIGTTEVQTFRMTNQTILISVRMRHLILKRNYYALFKCPLNNWKR